MKKTAKKSVKKAPAKKVAKKNSVAPVSQISKILSGLQADMKQLKKRYAKRNPEDAAEMYEKFHGKPADKTTKVIELRQYRDQLAALGDLISIEVKTPQGPRRTVALNEANRPLLTCTPDGAQLYIEGGDQSVDLDALGLQRGSLRKDSMNLGVIRKITYRTEKDFDAFETIDYYHMLGEDTGMYPVLIFDTLNNLLQIAGGEYIVKREGIVN